MTRQGGFGSEGQWRNTDDGRPGSALKFLRSSKAVPLLLVGGVAAVAVTAYALTTCAYQTYGNGSGTGSGTGTGVWVGGPHGFVGGYGGSSGGESGHAASGGTSRGGFGGTGHASGGS